MTQTLVEKIKEEKSEVNLKFEAKKRLRELMIITEEYVSDQQYAEMQIKGKFGGSLGQHFRHIVDVYICFIDGIKNNKIDYTSRKPKLRIEKNRSLGLDFAQDCYDSFSRLKLTDKSLEVIDDYGTTESSLFRELSHLAGHTIHHLAMIRIIMQENGIQLAKDRDDFGYAPCSIR